MAAPFSISKLIGLGVLMVAMLMVALPMIQQAYTQPSTNSMAANALASQVNCTTSKGANSITFNAPPNVSAQYAQAKCLEQAFYGYNNSVLTSPGSQYGFIFSLTNKTAFGTNSTASNSVSQTGFFVNIFQFTGLSFVFSGIGTIIQVMQTLGNVANLLFSTLIYWLPPVETIVISDVIKLVVFYIYIRMIMIGISGWMKMDLWST